ncbi:asparagine synthase (glutamine-hydrolyzing) [Pararhodonellum marinum]|uniref:asparagine synthase (glutamine-hydrolyzing) n=1 Tax=Pararhodonellum marinum TaxID=2755358 RepID=UPI00188FE2CB|nr:asparagine synthase (glutamine-hydrolyzing) [Pararhodonellum marinum]
MCGINLVLNNRDNGELAIQQMMEATRHRGPDQSDWIKVDQGVWLAGNRLKILDLRDIANQPVFSKDGKGILVWNGALYNYQDLRNELLDQGIVFETQSDSEVLVNWLRVFGQKGVSKLQGMFAFVFVDQEDQTIIVGRDPYGKKPLYYWESDGTWLFSSETKGILAAGLYRKKLESAQFLPYFYSRHTFPEETFFQNIFQWLPGKVMLLDYKGDILNQFYLEIFKRPIKLPSQNDFREMLTDAVLKHFHADVPVGIILSGGVDSTLLLQTWMQQTQVPLHTFTIGFEKKYQRNSKDARYAKTVAEKYHCAHHEITVTPELVMEQWQNYIVHLDQPIGDSAGFLTWKLAMSAKPYVKVLISGAGADELFGGYNRHKAYKWYLKHPHLSKFLIRFKNWVPTWSRAGRKFLDGLDNDKMATYINFSSLYQIPKSKLNAFSHFYPKQLPPYKAALEWDRSYYLIHDVLKIHDNACMSHGIEGRAPYLDQPLVEMSLSLSEDQHLNLGPKEWLNGLLNASGMEAVTKRKKMGFGLPLKDWMRDHPTFRKTILETLRRFEQKHGQDFPEEMLNLIQNAESRIKTDYLAIWNLFVLGSWLEYHHL